MKDILENSEVLGLLPIMTTSSSQWDLVTEDAWSQNFLPSVQNVEVKDGGGGGTVAVESTTALIGFHTSPPQKKNRVNIVVKIVNLKN